jgi:hypothetical protein
MTIQDVIDNDLIQDIRTGTASDDSVEMIDFPGAVMPNFEYSNCNRSWFGFNFEQYSHCFSVLEFGAWKDGFRSATRIILEGKSADTKYFGVSTVDVSHLDNGNDVNAIQRDESNYSDILDVASSKGVTAFDVIIFDAEASINQMLELWTATSLLAPGGMIVVHDVHYHPGPKTLVENLDPNKFLVEMRCVEKIMDYGIAFIKRK